jgi:hypothetical protein
VTPQPIEQSAPVLARNVGLQQPFPVPASLQPKPGHEFLSFFENSHSADYLAPELTVDCGYLHNSIHAP